MMDIEADGARNPREKYEGDLRQLREWNSRNVSRTGSREDEINPIEGLAPAGDALKAKQWLGRALYRRPSGGGFPANRSMKL